MKKAEKKEEIANVIDDLVFTWGKTHLTKVLFKSISDKLSIRYEYVCNCNLNDEVEANTEIPMTQKEFADLCFELQALCSIGETLSDIM